MNRPTAFRQFGSRAGLLLFLMLMAATLGACSSDSGASQTPDDKASSRPEAPTVELTGLNKDLLETSTIDKPILYSFWASWCGYCQNEIPMIDALYPEYKDRVEFVSINITHQDSMDGVRGFVDKHGLSMPVYLDMDGIASSSFGVLSVPTVVLVDQDGLLADKKVGASAEADGEEYRRKLEELLAAP